MTAGADEDELTPWLTLLLTERAAELDEGRTELVELAIEDEAEDDAWQTPEPGVEVSSYTLMPLTSQYLRVRQRLIKGPLN
jgi:hypothetical protein